MSINSAVTEAAARPYSRWRTGVVRAVIAVGLFVFTFFLRFNTLGGALGGFDDDHFVSFAYAKQVQAGARPLQDFTGLGLQSAWPPLTYDVSALAQSLLGNNLRSEALLAVTGIGLATVLAFLASTYVAPIAVAGGAAVVSALLATRLYNYPKVLALGAAMLLIALYARTPSRASLAALALLSAVAFLFRHDLAVYIGIGCVTAVIATAGALRPAVPRLLGYLSLCALLLAPSAIYIQLHGGMGAYVQDTVAAVRQEARRTERLNLGFVSRGEDGRQLSALEFLREERNAVQWLYYAHVALPLIVLAAALRPSRPRWPGSRPLLVAWGVMALVITPFFLRGNTGARFGDMAPVTAALLSVVCARAFHREGHLLSIVGRAGLAVVALLLSAQSVWAVGEVTHDLDVSGWRHSPIAVIRQAARRWGELAALPDAYWQGTPESPSVAAVQYLHGCTRPTDRILVISYRPELLPLADRRFAGGRASVIPGLLTDPAHQQLLVERWARESVPLVLVEPAEEHVYEIPVAYAHLIDHYVDSGPLPVNGGLTLHVYAERGRPTSGTFGPDVLPCFR